MLLALTVAGLAVVGGASDALASHRQSLFFEAPSELLNPATRPQTIAQLRDLGVKALRVELPWAGVAPGQTSANRPHFNAKSPASYHWGEYDALLSEAKRLHWQVLLTVAPPAPRWATSNRKAPYVTRPGDRDFREFMTAVGRHYRSEVSLFAIWNEPNEDGDLRPQFGPKGNPVAPRIYRGLFEAGYQGLRNAGLRHPKVLMGETSPGGFARKTPGLPRYVGVAPLTFLRGALCLTAHYKRAKTCGSLPAYGYAQHPYDSNKLGPFYRPKSAESVTIGTLGRLVVALNRAARSHAVRGGMPIFLTEFGVMSKPNRYFGVSGAKQAEYDAIAERIAWQNPRVAAFSQYLLKDDPPPHGPGVVSFQTGLRYAGGRKKPLYFGFPVPLTVTRKAHGFALWGLVRPAKGATKVTILVQRGHSRRYKRLKTVKTGAQGYWTTTSTVKARHWRVLWQSGPHAMKYEGPPITAYATPPPVAHVAKAAASRGRGKAASRGRSKAAANARRRAVSRAVHNRPHRNAR